MAIQQINLGTAPTGAGGDTQRIANTKINQNFSNAQHAASRLVGTGNGQIPSAEQTHIAAYKDISLEYSYGATFDANTTDMGSRVAVYPGATQINLDIPTIFGLKDLVVTTKSTKVSKVQYAESRVNTSLAKRIKYESDWGKWAVFYTTQNTTVDSNKNIKTSSPVLRVFKDKFEAVHEAEELDIKFTRNGTGDYTIEGTTGLRENDWQIVIPEDEHKNQLVAFTIDEDENGTIHLKTYKRIFNFETFRFEPDLSTHVDIPDNRWVDLHFNDLPQDETETGV